MFRYISYELFLNKETNQLIENITDKLKTLYAPINEKHH